MQHIRIDPACLLPAEQHFNPSIIRWRGRILMTYRYSTLQQHKDRKAQTAIAVLHPDCYEPIQNVHIDVGLDQVEDGRLFTINDRLFMSYSHRRNQYAVELDHDYEVIRKICLCVSIGTEKNWCFFDCDGYPFSIYKPSPWIIDTWDNDLRWLARYGDGVGVGLAWKWGEIRGGTPPIRLPAHLATLPDAPVFITFFHSKYGSPQPPYWTYVSGWIEFDAKPPFKPLRMSRQPLLAPDLTLYWRHQREKRSPHDMAVVFPCGAIAEGDKFIVSYGVNCCESWLAIFDKKELGDGIEV